ncbi:hypothetical protein HanRHA438_Chr14g0677241 [Helianthus annuus]|uniref:Kinetochore protein Ndc80 n=1 Tax=Helianthus annuus TaxID=4232 RepID=A0A251SL88_HELAN|nr:uncharacterized protein LOC110904810 [Helianthus annuus]KAF5771020.1 putative kinetochore protein Ndc80 [Helianthus annuus]KAJ0465884.1 hypothetical protein HanHA300_Chr14g0543021 [Helianthus annuus]KAJ0470800.1 hypothetical protein HanIR_Chr14g0722661 [Helianthus annuus]KAJ0487461.1 hypothetical protein HanHA89_Chr14g0590621 [Helianthus annuus]KAJ0657902.1 hypothetical protein HanLR1_Chr14g0551801 [Helianthus annuus]
MSSFTSFNPVNLSNIVKMAHSSFPDIWGWIQNLPPQTQWETNTKSICICSSSQTSIALSISKTLIHPSSISFSIIANYNLPISLWTSKPLKSTNNTFFHEQLTISKLLTNIIKDILNYTPINFSNSFLKLPEPNSIPNLKDIINFVFLALSFVVSVYEAPQDIRCDCINTLRDQFTCPWARETSKRLMKLIGSNAEEQWMRSMNLAITNWMMELRAMNHVLKAPSPMYSSALSGLGLWKIQLYCPLIAMDVEKCNSNGQDDQKLGFSLNYHQLEGVIQLNYQVMVREKWIDVLVSIDNVRCNIIRLVNETLMKERGAGIDEKHFPSRISLQLTPTIQTNILSVSVSRSSENPTLEIGVERSIEASFEPPNPHIGISVSAGETITTNLKPWKFEQSVYGNSGTFNWFLHDSVNGREVFSTKPSKFSLLQPKAWFRNRYSSAYRPFTRQGGVIFAGDEYGESVLWRFGSGAIGQTMEWEVRGWIWLTYWPNKYKTFYTETRRLEFREILSLTIA